MKLVLTLLVVFLLGATGVVIAFMMPEQETLELSGLVQAKEIKNASRFGGRVKDVLVKEGDVVQKGQKLIIFDDLELKSKIAEARATLTQAKAREGLLAQGPDHDDVQQAVSQVQQSQQNLRMLSQGARPEEITQALAKVQEAEGRYNTAKATLENSSQMLKEGIISQQKYNELKAQYDAAQSSLNASRANLKLMKTGARSEQISIARSQMTAAQAQLDKLRKGSKPEEIQIASAAIEQAQSVLTALEAQLSEMTVTAPIAGVISILNVNEGELIQPGRPVVSIIDYNHLWADIYIPESALDFVRTGEIVKIKSPVYPHSQFKGRVAFISPKSEFVPNGGSDASSSANASEQASFRVKVEIDSQDTTQRAQLHPGMKVNIAFSKERAL